MSRQVKYIYGTLAAGMAMFSCSGLLAQDKGKPFDTIQVNVITRYKPTIHDAVKLDNTPATADTVHLTRNVKYDMMNTQYPTSYMPPQLAALQLKGEPLEKLFHSLLNLGVGNYNTLYGEYFFNSLRSHDWDYGIHLNHLSSDFTTANYGYSAYAFNDVDGYVERFFNQHTLTAGVGFDNHILHDYGYNTIDNPIVDNSTTRVSYDTYKASLDYASAYHDSSKINHDIKLSYYDFGEADKYNYNPIENNVDANMNFFAYFNQQRLDLRADVGYNSYTYADPFYNPSIVGPESTAQNATYNTTNILLNPFFSTYEKHWDAHLGINVFYASNQPDNSGSINLYPDLIARYHVADDIVMFYAGIDGGQKLDSYKSLTDANAFADAFLPLNYTYTQYHAFVGIAGSITPKLTYNASVAQSMIKDMPLFITDTLETLRNRFTVVYDNVKVTNIHGDLDYKWRNKVSIILAGDYTIYTPTNQLKAWYNPALKVSATGKYTLNDKYIFKAEFFVVGSQYAPNMVDGIMTAKTLKGYPDLNVGVEYKYNKVFTAFLNLNNVANVAYYSWDNYEMERFNVMIGVRFGF